jgi:hypothetical protein
MTMMVEIVAQLFHVKIKAWLHVLMVHVLQPKLIVLNQVIVVLALLRTVMALVIALQTHGLEMVYVMVTIKHGAQTFVATIMMVATVLMLNVKVVQTLRAGMVVVPLLKLIVQI